MIVRESADTLCEPGLYFGPSTCANSRKIGQYDDIESHAFGIDTKSGHMKISKAGKSHAYMDEEYPGYHEDVENAYEGRIWKNHKIITFWNYPKPEHFQRIIKAIEAELMDKEGIQLNIWDNPEWKVEVMISPIDGKPAYDTKISPLIPMNYSTEYIPLKQYGGSISPKRVKHADSPMDKKTRKVHGGSKKYSKEKPLAWRQALVPESLEESISFERGQDVIKTMGLGKEAAIQKIKEQIKFEWHYHYEKAYIDFDQREALEIYKTGSGIEKIAVKEILEEFLSMKKKFRSYHANSWGMVELLDKTNLLLDPNYKWITPSNVDSVIGVISMPKTLKYIQQNWNPNQMYGAGIKHENINLMKIGIEQGATNLSIGGTTPYELAAENNDTELMKLLLANSEVDPGENSKEGKRSNRDESQYAFRRAARRGHYEIVKIMLEDPRVDPSVKNNFALNWSFKEGHMDVVDLLLDDPRVQAKINYLPQTRIKDLIKAGLIH